ncbi:MAG: hypothetical protein U9R15_06895, partial [Chloroflexota bacterium]|nr:hypothetical protein [Chloroflexota bacterium]
MNPVGNVYCDKCNARLVPMTAPPAQEKEPKPTPIKGFALPTVPLKEKPVTDATAEIEMEEEGGDWLSQLRASTTEESEEPEPVVKPLDSGEEGAEDWLSPLRVSAGTSAAEELEEAEPISAPVEPVEIPDWLRDMGPVGGEGEPSPVEEQPVIVEPVERESDSMPPLAPAQVPDWLRDAAPDEAPEPEAAPPAAAAEVEEPAPALAEIPDWLRDVAPDEEAAAPEPEAAPPAAEAVLEEPTSPFVDTVPLAASEAPEWLDELQPEGAPPAETAAPVFEGPISPTPQIETAEAAGLVRAEIPAWLEAARPKEETAGAIAGEGAVETEGLLEGLRGVLPLAAAVEMPVAREGALPPVQKMAREASLARARLLQDLLSQPAETPQPEARKPVATVSEHLQRLVVGVVLLLSVLAILAWRPLMGGEAPLLTRPGQLSTGAKGLYNTIEGVSAGDSVLVAFEYGPAEADELDMVAGPILRHLVDQGADISIASTRPDGLMVAARVWGDTWKVIRDSPSPEE